jgi:L-cysteine S-thiosulfotransferase
MKKIATALSVMLIAATPFAAQATPDDDLKALRSYFAKKFPNVPENDFINGVYAIDKNSREQWEAFEEFPSYEIAIEKGKDKFNKKFANGKGYADCFPNYKKGIKQNYPYFDTDKGEIVTIEGAINKCRTDNGEKKLKWKKGEITQIGAYLSSLSRGQTINVKVPNDAKAIAAYNRGKQIYWAKRGQLNMACADCHYYYTGSKMRANVLGPAYGQTSGFPIYRNKWGGMGTLHRRYGGCNKQVRAKPFKAQSDEYKALEYYHTYMSNGLKINGPSQRM